MTCLPWALLAEDSLEAKLQRRAASQRQGGGEQFARCSQAARAADQDRGFRNALLTAAADTPSPRASSDWLAYTPSSSIRRQARACAPGSGRAGFGEAVFSSPGGVQPFVGFTSGASTRMRNCGHGGLVQLLKSQDRDTNNPGAQMDMGPEEILLLISRNPEQTRARLEAVRAQREAEAKKKIASEASKLLRAINARFRGAERTRDAIEAARLRGEAEERLKHLGRMNPEAWPWAQYAGVVRQQPVLVPEGGGPVYEGLRVGIPSAWNADRIEYVEFGQVTRDGQIALRAAGEATWKLVKSDDGRLSALRPEHFGADWPQDEEGFTVRALEQHAENRLRYQGDWPGMGWQQAPDAWVERLWGLMGERIVAALSKVSYYNAQAQRVPVMAPAGLRVVNAGAASGTAGITVLAPTEAGWRAFLAAAPASGLKFGELSEAGRWWWGRAIPRNLLSGAEVDGEDSVGEAA